MAEWLSDTWTDMKSAITTVWPEITVIFKEVQMQKRNWYNLIEKGELVPPWVVVELPPWEDDDGWGTANQTYRNRISIYYISQDTGSAVQTALEAKAQLLQDKLLAPSNGYAFMVLPEGMTIDANEANGANRAFRDANQPLSASVLMFTAIGGYGLAYI